MDDDRAGVAGYIERIRDARRAVRGVDAAMAEEVDYRRAAGVPFVEDERFHELNERAEQAHAAVWAAWWGRDRGAVATAAAVAAAHDAVQGVTGSDARGGAEVSGGAGDDDGRCRELDRCREHDDGSGQAVRDDDAAGRES